MAGAQRVFQGQCGDGHPMLGSSAGHPYVGFCAHLDCLEEWKALVGYETLETSDQLYHLLHVTILIGSVEHRGRRRKRLVTLAFIQTLLQACLPQIDLHVITTSHQ